jgi:hypothetical protein
VPAKTRRTSADRWARAMRGGVMGVAIPVDVVTGRGPDPGAARC